MAPDGWAGHGWAATAGGIVMAPATLLSGHSFESSIATRYPCRRARSTPNRTSLCRSVMRDRDRGYGISSGAGIPIPYRSSSLHACASGVDDGRGKVPSDCAPKCGRRLVPSKHRSRPTMRRSTLGCLAG